MTDQPTTVTPDDASDEAVAGGVVFQCQRCGLDMPPMPKDLAKLAQTTAGVTLAHSVCPGAEVPAGPLQRSFELRAQIVERTADDDNPELRNGVREFMRFVVPVEADDLDSAMRPLALAFGEKWAHAEKQAKIADAPEDL